MQSEQFDFKAVQIYLVDNLEESSVNEMWRSLCSTMLQVSLLWNILFNSVFSGK